MAHLTVYLHFANNCQEAMEFYHQCLGGDLNIQTVGDSPMAAQMPVESHNSVMHSTLVTSGITLMASDMSDADQVNTLGSMSLCLYSEDKDEIRDLYQKFSQDAQSTEPLKDEFFGLFGAVVDKFGKRWMFQGGKM
jgi:PhnB protein